MAADRRVIARADYRTIETGESDGESPALATLMKTVRSRRKSGASAATLDRRHIFVIAAGVKGRVEFAQLAADWPEVVWQEFAAGHDFLRAASGLGTGCVVIFDPLPDIEALAIVAWLGQQRPDLASIVVSAKPTVSGAVECLKAGAADYLGLPLDRAAGSTALRAAFEPGPERQTRSSALARVKLTSRLSQRELQVLDGLLAGMSNKQVGAKLHISERTVEVHRSRIMRRLGVESFAELVRMAVQAGIAGA